VHLHRRDTVRFHVLSLVFPKKDNVLAERPDEVFALRLCTLVPVGTLVATRAPLGVLACLGGPLFHRVRQIAGWIVPLGMDAQEIVPRIVPIPIPLPLPVRVVP